MKIRHNGSAQNALRNLSQNSAALSKNLEKLSSGYKINRSADDAAGLGVSQKMRAQIMELSTAEGNIEAGKNLIDTAEGSMQEIHAMLRRMKKLAATSANGTYDDDHDRAALQREIDQLCGEINRVADTSNFNRIPLLDGSIMGHYEVKQPKELAQFQFGVGGSGTLPEVGRGTRLQGRSISPTASRFSVDLDNVWLNNMADGGAVTVKIGSAEITVPANPDFADHAAPGTAVFGKMDGASVVDAIIAGKNGHVPVEGLTTDLSGNCCVEIDGKKFRLSKGKPGNRLQLTQTPLPANKAEVAQSSLEVSIGGVNGAAELAPLPAQKGKWEFALYEPFSCGETLSVPVIGPDGKETVRTIKFVEDGQDPFDADTMVNISYRHTRAEQLQGAADLLAQTEPIKSHFDVQASGESMTFIQKTPNSGFTCGKPEIKPGAPWGQAPAAPVHISTTREGKKVFAVKPGPFGLQDRLTISYGGRSKDIHFYDRTQIKLPVTWNRVDLRELDQDQNLAAEISQSLGHAFEDFDLSWSGGQLLLTQKTPGAGDAAQLQFTMGKDITADLQFNTVQKPRPELGTGLPRKMDTVEVHKGHYGEGNYPTSTSFEMTPEMTAHGCTFVIGDQQYTVGKEIPYPAQLPGHTGYLEEVARGLADAAKGNNTWRVDCTGRTITLTSRLPGNGKGLDVTRESGILSSVQRTLTNLEEGLKLLIGESGNEQNILTVLIHDAHTYSLGIDPLDVSTLDNAAVASRQLDGAIAQISAERGYLGGITNRLDHTYESVTITRENIQEAESVLRDTDMAEEVTAMTKNQILQQSAQAMLAQANQTPQRILELLQ